MQKRKKELKLQEEQLIRRREIELKHIRDIKELYDRKLERVNQLYLELSSVLLQLEQQKQEGRKREMQCKRRFIQPFMKKLENRRNGHISTTPTSPECSLTSPDSPQTVSSLVVLMSKKFAPGYSCLWYSASSVWDSQVVLIFHVPVLS